jgi:hypothetical protein
MNDKPEIKCKICGCITEKYATGGSGSYIKGTTVGKYLSEERKQKVRRAQISVRQLERYGGSNKLVPNVDGQEVENWKEAKLLAKSKGAKDTKKFDRYVRNEESSNNSAGINEKRYKKLKEVAKNIH